MEAVGEIILGSFLFVVLLFDLMFVCLFVYSFCVMSFSLLDWLFFCLWTCFSLSIPPSFLPTVMVSLKVFFFRCFLFVYVVCFFRG